jgi:hypothetical protein
MTAPTMTVSNNRTVITMSVASKGTKTSITTTSTTTKEVPKTVMPLNRPVALMTLRKTRKLSATSQ